MFNTRTYNVTFELSFYAKAAAIRALEQMAAEKRAVAVGRLPGSDSARDLIECAQQLSDAADALRHARPEPKLEYVSYRQWLTYVNECVWLTAACSIADMSDGLFRDWYEEGMTPAAAAAQAIEMS